MTRVHLICGYFDLLVFLEFHVTCKYGCLGLPIFLPFGYQRARKFWNDKFSEFIYNHFKWTLMTRTDDLLEIN